MLFPHWHPKTYATVVREPASENIKKKEEEDVNDNEITNTKGKKK